MSVWLVVAGLSLIFADILFVAVEAKSPHEWRHDWSPKVAFPVLLLGFVISLAGLFVR